MGFRAHVLLMALAMNVLYLGKLALFAYLSLIASMVFAIGTGMGYGLLMYTLYPSEYGHKMFVLWSGALLVLSAIYLGLGLLLHHLLAVL